MLVDRQDWEYSGSTNIQKVIKKIFTTPYLPSKASEKVNERIYVAVL